jgi:hypothetical protein
MRNVFRRDLEYLSPGRSYRRIEADSTGFIPGQFTLTLLIAAFKIRLP